MLTAVNKKKKEKEKKESSVRWIQAEALQHNNIKTDRNRDTNSIGTFVTGYKVVVRDFVPVRVEERRTYSRTLNSGQVIVHTKKFLRAMELRKFKFILVGR